MTIRQVKGAFEKYVPLDFEEAEQGLRSFSTHSSNEISSRPNDSVADEKSSDCWDVRVISESLDEAKEVGRRSYDEGSEDEANYDDDFHSDDDELDGGELLRKAAGPGELPAEAAALRDPSESYIDPEALVESLEHLILEARDRSIQSLGEALFFKIYQLCSDCMVGEGSGRDQSEEKKSDNKVSKNANMLKDLESALCDQLQGGLEVACDAVFGVKVLLALESKLLAVQAPKQDG